MSIITLSNVKDIMSEIRQGRMVILVDDDANSINEGVVMVAADHCEASHINFMARKAKGLVCLSLTLERCAQLDLANMVPGASENKPNFTTSIEAATGIDTGISAADRAHTVRTAVAQYATPEDIVQPGHVFPLMATSGGVLMRAGLTEAASDYAGLSGLSPAAVIANILTLEGELAESSALVKFATSHGLKMGSVADLINFRLKNECTVSRIRIGDIETAFGFFNVIVYKDSVDQGVHIALWRGDIRREVATLVRVHVSSKMRDLVRCKSLSSRSWNLAQTLRFVSDSSTGVVVLLEGKETEQQILSNIDFSLGISEIDSYAHVDSSKNVGLGAQILRDLGVGKIRLMGAPIKYNALSGFGLEVVDFVSPNIGQD